MGKETIVSTWDLLKATTEKKKKALVLLASVFPVICVVGHCWETFTHLAFQEMEGLPAVLEFCH